MTDSIKIHCKYDELLQPGDLKPHPKNRNKHPKDQIKTLARIIDYQGWRYPVKVSKASGYVTSGHGRIEAAKILECPIPVNYQEYVSEEQEYADVQSDNAIAAWSELDLSGINSDIGDLGPDFDVDLLGIKDFVIEPADKYGGKDEDDVPEEPEEPKTKLGDLYRLGEHRLLCGDATKSEDVDRLLDGQTIDMVYTDPPYGMNLDTDYSKMKKSDHKFDKVIGDDVEYDATNVLSIFKATKEVFLFGADYYCWSIPRGGSWVVWDKRQSDRLNIPQTLDKTFGSCFELCWSKTKHKRDIARIVWTAGLGQGFDEERVGRNNSPKRVHPTQKPIELAEWFFDKWGKDTKTVADLYGGSGSTLIACEKTNRKCFMMELEPKYCDVIVKRWEEYTGEKAELLNG